MKDLTGQVFGRLTVVEYAGKGEGRGHYWSCSCECGGETAVEDYDLKSGNTRSCGCYHAERAREAKTTHGKAGAETRTPEYTVWACVIQRCLNPNNAAYHNYGGRGIRICDHWRSFENFLADMGERPDGTTLDRIDNDGDYEPENCRWATWEEQQRNRRSNHILEYNGRSQCMMDWAEEVGISYSTLRSRINRDGWTVERALTTPVR